MIKFISKLDIFGIYFVYLQNVNRILHEMITKELIAPKSIVVVGGSKSIVVVGGSDDVHKPGGATLKNLLNTHYAGELYVVNPKCDTAQGVKSYRATRPRESSPTGT